MYEPTQVPEEIKYSFASTCEPLPIAQVIEEAEPTIYKSLPLPDLSVNHFHEPVGDSKSICCNKLDVMFAEAESVKTKKVAIQTKKANKK